jgi:WD40 repeat protein
MASVRSARFSPDDSQVLTASADGTARIWEVASGRCLHVLSGHAEALHSAEWSPDGTQIVTTCSDGTIGLWDGNDPDRLPRFTTYEDEVASLALFSGDSARIAVIR